MSANRRVFGIFFNERRVSTRGYNRRGELDLIFSSAKVGGIDRRTNDDSSVFRVWDEWKPDRIVGCEYKSGIGRRIVFSRGWRTKGFDKS